jgi:hypothetical protein
MAFLCRAVVLSALLAGTTGGCLDGESAFVRACELALVERLKSPSTYRRVEATVAREPLGLDDYFAGRDDGPAVRKFAEQQGLKPIRVLALVEFEVENALGVSVLSLATCSLDTRDGDPSAASPMLVRIDGKTWTEWLADRAARLRQE